MTTRFSWFQLGAFWRRMSILDRIALAVGILALISRADWFNIAMPGSGFLGFLLFLAIAYFLVRVLPVVRRRLLWSLRNRLIVAYVFIAVVPIVLLLAMVSVASYMLYLQFGAHLLHDSLSGQFGYVQAAADEIAQTILQEPSNMGRLEPSPLDRARVLAVVHAAQDELPGLQIELDRGRSLLGVNSSDPQSFQGIVDRRGMLYLCGVVLRSNSKAQVVLSALVPITPELLDSLRSELGPIQLTLFRPATKSDNQSFTLDIDGKRYVTEHISSHQRRLSPRRDWLDLPIAGLSTLDVYAEDGHVLSGRANQVFASFQVRRSTLNQRLFTGAVGSTLTVVLEIIGVMFLLLGVGGLITGIVLSRRITGAVSDLYEATRHVRRGDFTHRVHVAQRDQLGVLGESFNEMTSSISELIEEQRKRQRLENEISIAREVQSQLFPRALPRLPGVELAAICRAARTVSGDYYDFIRLGPSQLAIALADISGKGISAALLMASLQAALRSQALLDGDCSTAKLVERVNQHLFHNTSDDRYATFFYAVYDTATRILSYTNAGHLPPFFVAGGKTAKLDMGGTVVGLFDEAEYEQGQMRVAPGSLLVAFSDGLTEPENVYGEEFGDRRLLDEVLRHSNAPAQRLAETVIDSAEQWGSTPEQADDMTVVVARLG